MVRIRHGGMNRTMSLEEDDDDWFSSSFGDTAVDKGPAKAASSRKRPAATKANDLWADRHGPTREAHLAVHKKKTGDVRDWLVRSLKTAGSVPKSKYDCSRVLLLSGPAGCGKTAVVRVLAAELGCELVEWVNPQVQREWSFDSPEGREQFAESTLSQFKSFLLQSQRYPTLSLGGLGGSSSTGASSAKTHKIIILEELPTVFSMSGWADTFHDLIRQFAATSRYPLVMIVSQQKSGKLRLAKLFSKAFLGCGMLRDITFNPVPVTYITKALTRIATAENKSNPRTKIPSPAALRAMAEASEGDIRNAVNALQFYTRKTDPADRARSRKRKRTASTKSEPVSMPAGLGGRDASIILFRALGRIFHVKREDADVVCTTLPPRHRQHERLPLLAKLPPESVVELSQMDVGIFSAYLHENYHLFFGDTEDMLQGLDYLCSADLLTREWQHQSIMGEYAAAVACRGMVFANQHPPPRRWLSTNKPKLFEVEHQATDRHEALQLALRRSTGSSGNLHLGTYTRRSLVLGIAPYLRIVQPLDLAPDVREQVRALGRLSRFGYRGKQSGTMRESDLDQYEGAADEDNEFDTEDAAAPVDGAPASCSQASGQGQVAVAASQPPTLTSGLSNGFEGLSVAADDIEGFSSDDDGL